MSNACFPLTLTLIPQGEGTVAGTFSTSEAPLANAALRPFMAIRTETKAANDSPCPCGRGLG